MIDSTATDKTLVPAEFHIFNIIELLQPRLVRTGFLESCYKWARWLQNHEGTQRYGGHHYPSSRGVEALVAALRCLFRIGDGRADSMVIKSRSSTSWTIAFVEWCTGIVPNICDASGGIILAAPESPVTLVVCSDERMGSDVQVELFTLSKSLLDVFTVPMSLTDDEELRNYHGIISVRSHGLQTLQDLHCISGSNLRAMVEALSYLLGQAQKWVIPTCDGLDVPRGIALTKSYSSPTEEEFLWARCSPEFFSTEKILLAASVYLGDTGFKISRLKDLASGAFRKYFDTNHSSRGANYNIDSH